jgi:hypothetical protein
MVANCQQTAANTSAPTVPPTIKTAIRQGHAAGGDDQKSASTQPRASAKVPDGGCARRRSLNRHLVPCRRSAQRALATIRLTGTRTSVAAPACPSSCVPMTSAAQVALALAHQASNPRSSAGRERNAPTDPAAATPTRAQTSAWRSVAWGSQRHHWSIPAGARSRCLRGDRATPYTTSATPKKKTKTGCRRNAKRAAQPMVAQETNARPVDNTSA